MSTRTDSAGVAVVEFAGEDQPLAWTFDSLFSLGGAESGPEAFYEVSTIGVAVDPFGNIYVLDRSGSQVIVFDSSGVHLRTVGSAGGGPGEFQFPIGVAVTEDGTVLVADVGKRAIVRFGPDGQVLEQMRMTGGFFGGPLGVAAGELVISVGGDLHDPDARIERLVRVRGGDTTDLVTVAHENLGMITLPSCGISFTGMGPMFAPTLRWTVTEGQVAVAQSAAYEVRLYGADGLATIVRRAIPPRVPTRADALAQLGDGMTVRTSGGPRTCDPDELIDRRGLADAIPVIQRLAGGPFGTLWVWRDGTNAVDVYDGTGEYLGSLDSPPFVVATIGDDRVVARTQDEFDVQRLVIYRVRRE